MPPQALTGTDITYSYTITSGDVLIACLLVVIIFGGSAAYIIHFLWGRK